MKANFTRFPSRRRPPLFLGFLDPFAMSRSPSGSRPTRVPIAQSFRLASRPREVASAMPCLSSAFATSPTVCTTYEASNPIPPKARDTSRIVRSLFRSISMPRCEILLCKRVLLLCGPRIRFSCQRNRGNSTIPLQDLRRALRGSAPGVSSPPRPCARRRSYLRQHAWRGMRLWAVGPACGLLRHP